MECPERIREWANHGRPSIARTILRERTKLEASHWFQTIAESDSLQNSMAMAWKRTHRPMKQNRKPRHKPTHLWLINLPQSSQQSVWEMAIFSMKTLGKPTAMCKRMKQNPYLLPDPKVTAKWIKYLSAQLEVIKLLDEGIHSHRSLRYVLDLTPKHKATKGKINQWKYITLKTSIQQRKPKIKIIWKGNQWVGEDIWKECFW